MTHVSQGNTHAREMPSPRNSDYVELMHFVSSLAALSSEAMIELVHIKNPP